jgi:hypothetical protein
MISTSGNFSEASENSQLTRFLPTYTNASIRLVYPWSGPGILVPYEIWGNLLLADGDKSQNRFESKCRRRKMNVWVVDELLSTVETV